jgi:hypothetical protein
MRAVLALLVATLAIPAAAQLDAITNRDATAGLRAALEKGAVAEKYNEYAEKGARFGLVSKEHANLDNYVTQKALDGLFVMVAEEEKKIRQDPMQAGSAIIRKVFGALR